MRNCGLTAKKARRGKGRQIWKIKKGVRINVNTLQINQQNINVNLHHNKKGRSNKQKEQV